LEVGLPQFNLGSRALRIKEAGKLTMIFSDLHLRDDFPTEWTVFLFLKKVLSECWALSADPKYDILLSMASFGFSKGFPEIH